MNNENPERVTTNDGVVEAQPSVAHAGEEKKFTIKRVIGAEGFITLGILLAVFVPIAIIMGFDNMLNTLFNNAYDLLIGTCLYLMAVAVVVGALSSVLTEFGVIALANRALSPLMKPLYGMPGATSVAVFSAFLSVFRYCA